MESFRLILQNELLQRCRNNPKYSLRAFARALQIEPSALSQILNAKRPITKKMKLRLGMALGMKVSEIEKMNVKSARFQQIALDSFAIISDWYHYAIIELTYLDDFKPDSAWISRRLDITKQEANIAIERLFRLGLLEETKNSNWRDTAENGQLTHLVPDITSDAARKYQRQLLELSKHAIQEVPLEQRNHTSAAFCFDTTDLPRAIEKITEFRRKFAKEFQPNKKANEVYQLQISLFPLTKKINEEKV